MLDEGHAVLSPSSSARWMACPGSIAAQAAITESDTGNDASRDGTVAHALLELCLLFGFEPEEFIDEHILGDEMPVVAQHMVDGVQHVLDYVEEYLDTYGAKNVIVLPEHRVYIGSMIGVTDEVCNGTTDVQLVHRNNLCLVTIDYKHGMVPVDADNNAQMMMYTIGGVKEHGKFKEYKNVIVQPRAAKRRTVEEHSFKQGRLTTFMHEAGRAAQVALSPNAPRVAGEHCRYCKAKNNCQTYRRRARQVAADEFGEIPDAETIPDEQLNEILKEAALLENWIKAVRARALAFAQGGGQLADFVLGWGVRKRIFQDEADVIAWCHKKKLPLDVFMPRELVSPKALETILKRHKLYPVAKRGQEKPDSPIAHLVGYTNPKPALKSRKATDDFEAVEDGDEE